MNKDKMIHPAHGWSGPDEAFWGPSQVTILKNTKGGKYIQPLVYSAVPIRWGRIPKNRRNRTRIPKDTLEKDDFRCRKEFMFAIQLPGKTVAEIQKNFRVKLFIRKYMGTSTVEIRGQHATICCLLDENQLCITSFLFCDDDRDLIACIWYCKSHHVNCITRYIDGKEPCLSFMML